MTIDTSREAVERRIAEFTSPSRTYMQAVEKSMGYADLARDLVPALLAERDAALAEVARLSHALAAETAKREAMEAALYGLAKACEGEPSEVFEGEIGAALTHAHATLAKHGSKT